MKTSSYWLSVSGSSLLTAIALTIGLSVSAQTVTDADGNVYNTVTIGTQTWMVENLKTTKYNDGSDIPLVEDAAAWAALSTPGFCWYNNDAIANKATYGALYNWNTVNTGKLCPAGWHVPTDAEWKTLEVYLGLTQAEADAAGWRGTDQGTQLKNSTGWNSGGNGTNTSGYSALPGGFRADNGAFSNVGNFGYWWSSTEYDTYLAWYRLLNLSNIDVYRYYSFKNYGFSVRCVKDFDPFDYLIITQAATEITSNSATSVGEITDQGGEPITERGVCWSTAPNPTIADSKTSDGTGAGTFISSIAGLLANTTYYARAYVTNTAGTAYGNEISFTTASGSETVTDADGNVYNTVTIGTQTWMAENLKTTKYNDGVDILLVEDSASWSGLSTPGFCWYNNDASTYKATYGALYNWYTVNTGKLCPMGWHVPAEAEWTVLTDYLGGEAVAGGKLKEAGLAHWISPNTGATNESGFTALPGGDRFYNNSTFNNAGLLGYWWSSTEYSSTLSYYRALRLVNTSVGQGSYDKTYGFSVRCVKDFDPFDYLIITQAATEITSNSATSGGEITDQGGEPITERGVCWSTIPNPTITDSKTSDGTGSGTFTSSIAGLLANTTYYARAYATNSTGTAYGNEISFTTLSVGDICNNTAPEKDQVLAALSTYVFDGNPLASLTEAENILKFLCPDAVIHYPNSITVCATLNTGYHITLWAETYGHTDRYGARYGTDPNHSYWLSNDTYFEIFKPAVPITTCNELFFDSGGESGNYSDNEDKTWVYFPANSDSKLSVQFNTFTTEDGFDLLYIFDGPDTSSPQFPGSPFTGTLSPGTILASSENTSGAITFQFTSDVSVNDIGWSATINCKAEVIIIAETNYGDPPDWDWVQLVGGSGESVTSDVEIDPSGNVYVTGFFVDSMKIGTTKLLASGTKDMFIAKYNSSGTLQWVKTATTGNKLNEISGISLEYSPYGIYVTGNFRGNQINFGAGNISFTDDSNNQNSFVARYTTTGSLDWVKYDEINVYSLLEYRADIFYAVCNGNQIYCKDKDWNNTNFIDVGYQIKDIEITSGYLYTVCNDSPEKMKIMQFNLSGYLNWELTDESSNAYSWSSSLSLDLDGNIYVTGGIYNDFQMQGYTVLNEGNGNLIVVKVSPSGTVDWITQLNADSDNYNSLRSTFSGTKLYVSASSYQETTLGSTIIPANTNFIAELGTNGTIVSGFVYNHPVNELVSDANYLYSCGNNSTRIVDKFSFNGTSAWQGTSESYAGNSVIWYMSDVDESGNILLHGWINGITTIGNTRIDAGNDNLYVAKLDIAGNLKWIKTGRDQGYGSTSGICHDQMGNIIAWGTFSDTLEFEGIKVYEPIYGAYIVKYDPDGKLLWLNYFTSSADILGIGGIDTDEFGNIIITGAFRGDVVFKNNTHTSVSGGLDIFVAKYDPDGILLWSKSYGSTSTDYGRSVSIDKNNNILIAGRYGQTIQFGNYSLPRTGGSDLFIAKLPPDGNDQNIIAVKAGGTSSESANSIATADNGDVYISGYMNSLEAVFQDTTVYRDPALAQALFVARYTADLNLEWVSIMSSDYVWPLYKMDVDKEGNCYMGGQVGTQLLLPGDVSISSNGSMGLFVCRYDKSGELNWLKSIRAESGFSGLFSVSAIDVDNIVLGGRLSNDIGIFDDQTLFSTNDNAFLAAIRSEETLSVYIEKTDVSLPGAKDGNINLSVSGGTTPYTYSWNTVASTEDLSLLNPGTYTVTITDAADFTVVKTIRIYEAPVYLCEARFNIAWDTTAIFTDLSIGDPKAWYWNFGDGTNSTLQNPEHIYSKEGSYNVSLTIFNSLTNCVSTVTNTVFAGSVDCQADFSFVLNSVSGFASFTSASLNSTDYFWDFGNGTYSSQMNPECTYLKAGMYDVCLTIKDNVSGCQSEMCKNLTFIPEGEKYITADFSFFSGTTDNTVTFNDLSSSNTTDWYWTIGDGKVVSTENPVYTYSNPGVYSVCLTAIDRVNLLMNTVCKEVKVGETDCNIAAEFSYFIDPDEQSAAFSNKSVGSVTDYFWTFGDGGSSSLENPTHSYSSPGFYLVGLSVRNSSNKCMDMTAQFIQVGGVDCRAGFTFGVNPLTNTVSFMDDSKGDIDYYYWDFGDGSFSTLENPAKLYKKAGIFLVGQTVIDNTNECIDVFYQPVQAGEIDCAAEFVSYVDAATSTAYFTNKVVGESTALLWSFGDGRFSTSDNPVHIFPSAGIYSVGLNTYDFNSGCMDYYQEKLLIGGLGIDCEADFAYLVDPSDPEVTFKNKSVGDIVSSLWNFGDGSENSEDTDPAHTFTKGGYYYVCLNVTNSSGIRNMTCKWILVEGSAANDCRANFMFSIDSATRKVIFVDNSFGEPDKYNWDFGDSRADSVSKVKDPTHNYDTKGYYLVHLKIEKSTSGCVSSEYKLLNVAELQVLKAAFGYEARDPDKKLSGYPVDMVSASSGDGATVEWDFGDKQIKKETFTVMDSTSGIVTHYYEKPGKYRVCLRISDKVSGQTDEYCQFVFTKFGVGVEQITGNESNLAVYPNPFMDYTTISYSVPEHQFVELAVFDQMGRRMETLVKSRKDAGEYQIVWEAKGIAPGIYHLKLITEKGIFTKQLVVTR